MKFKFGKNILVISLMTLLTVFSWIGFEVYRAYTKTTIPLIIKKLITPLTPAIDETVLIDIEEKYQPSTEEINVVSAPLSSPTSEVETKEGTSKTATESGNLNEE